MKKTITLALVSLFLVTLIGITVSAFEIDNVRSYDEETKTITITNAFGLGDTISKVQLKTPLNYLVPRGYHKVAEFTIENYDDYSNVFNDMEFFDLRKDGESFTRSFDYKYKTIIQVPEYEIICNESFLTNGTKIDNCTKKQIGLKDKVIWKELNEIEGLLKGNITIGIFTEVKRRDKVEWIPTLFGERINEWATWTASLNVGLTSYYTMDNLNSTGNGAFNNVTETHDLLVVNNSLGMTLVSGIIGNAMNFTQDGNYSVINHTLNLNTTFSVNYWTNVYGLSGVNNLAFNPSTTQGGGINGIVMNIRDTNIPELEGTNATPYAANISIIQGTPFMTTITSNGTFAKLYINSSLVLIAPLQTDRDWTNLWVHFPRFNVPANGWYDEIGIWNRTLEASESSDLYNNGIGITYKNIFGPIITLNSPIESFNTTDNTINFNGTVVSPIGVINVTLFIDGILNETNSSEINDTDYLFTKIISDGSHNWTYVSCNSDDCATAPTRTFTISNFIENSQTFNTSSFETAQENFIINITTNGSTPSSAELIYNGTIFSSAIITSIGGNDFNITRSIDIPLVNETKSFFFNVTIDGIESSSSTQNQLINLTDFQHITTGSSYINISFKNETVGEELVTGEIDADWTFWLGSGTVFKTLSFTNTSENAKYEFTLLNGSNRTLTANVSLTYDNSISEQRSFSKSYNLTNITTNQTLFLLPTADGIFVTFQTVTIAEQVINEVATNVTKGTDLISTGMTDDAGLVQFFLDPDTTYVFSFFKEGFDLVTTTLKPTQSSFTIIMGGAAIIVQNDTTKGISYFTNPISNVLSNNTETEFNLSFFSVFWGLDSFGFVLKNSTGDVFNITTSTIETGGFLSRNLNTGNNTDIQMEIFWTINGNQTNVTRTWLVRDTADEGFSIRTFFNDLSTFLTSGLFGLTSFGLGIIIFMIIIIVTGVLSVKFGITNPAGISIIVFAMVLFFDVGLGIMPNPVNAVPNFPTIFVGLVFLGTLVKEAIIR